MATRNEMLVISPIWGLTIDLIRFSGSGEGLDMALFTAWSIMQ